jgi:hypothetical protein
MKKEAIIKFLVVFLVWIVIFSSFISAGLGIKWTSESVMVNEGERVCLNSYSIYNPWGADSNVVVTLSKELKEILVMQETTTKTIPAFTSSSESIPMEFCFEVPKVYERDHVIAGRFIDKLDCSEETKVYEGEVVVESAPVSSQMSGIGGSATKMSVSAPLRVRVRCNAYSWDYTLAYVLAAVLSGGFIFMILFRKYRKPKAQRIKEKMKKLRSEMRKSKKK